jgi:hypothetical protein
MSYSPLVFESMEIGLAKISFFNASGSLENILNQVSRIENKAEILDIIKVESGQNWQEHPMVKEILQKFPDSEIEIVDI